MLHFLNFHDTKGDYIISKLDQASTQLNLQGGYHNEKNVDAYDDEYIGLPRYLNRMCSRYE
jgi:uncharacterized protein YutD